MALTLTTTRVAGDAGAEGRTNTAAATTSPATTANKLAAANANTSAARDYAAANAGAKSAGSITLGGEGSFFHGGDTSTPTVPTVPQGGGGGGGGGGTAAAAATPVQHSIGAAITPQSTGVNADYINQMYDAKRAGDLAGLENAYNQNLANAQLSMERLDPTYAAQKNDLTTAYERNRMNFNNSAAASGLNVGAGAQAQLAMNSAYGRDMARLGAAQADATAQAQRDMDALTANYQNAVQQAISDNDWNRANALMQQMDKDANKQAQDAQLLASYGNFSGYESIYGTEAAQAMKEIWIAQNPLLAYNTGNISAGEYQKITGSPVPGTKRSSGGGTYRKPYDQMTPEEQAEYWRNYGSAIYGDNSALVNNYVINQMLAQTDLYR